MKMSDLWRYGDGEGIQGVMSGFIWYDVYSLKSPETIRSEDLLETALVEEVRSNREVEVVSTEVCTPYGSAWCAEYWNDLLINVQDYNSKTVKRKRRKNTRKKRVWHITRGKRRKMLPYSYYSHYDIDGMAVCSEQQYFTSSCYSNCDLITIKKTDNVVSVYKSPYTSIPSHMSNHSTSHNPIDLRSILSDIVSTNGVLIESVEALAELGRTINVLARLSDMFTKLIQIRNSKFNITKVVENREDRWLPSWHYLDYEFGIKPMATFLSEFALTMQNLDQVLRRLHLGMFRRIIRTERTDDYDISNKYGYIIESVRNANNKYTAYVDFKVVDETKFMNAVNTIAPLSFNTIWQAIPNSWFLDAWLQIDALLHSLEMRPVFGIDVSISICHTNATVVTSNTILEDSICNQTDALSKTINITRTTANPSYEQLAIQPYFIMPFQNLDEAYLRIPKASALVNFGFTFVSDHQELVEKSVAKRRVQ